MHAMGHPNTPPPLPWLQAGDSFPPVIQAWGANSPAPGLLAAGGALDSETLRAAYRCGIFPWFSDGQPVLWWSTDPRMVLPPADFRLHRSLRKQLHSLLVTNRLEIRMDHDFRSVMSACAHAPRIGQDGTWIVQDMLDAYADLHRDGHAHSVETWMDGELVGGLYVVNVGRMVFGESMFSKVSNASKIALCALVCFCRKNSLPLIDCQQQTAHLATLGAAPISREEFCARLVSLVEEAAPLWQFEKADWVHLLN